MTRETLIRVKHLGKCYNIYEQPSDRLFQGLQILWRGKKRYAREFWALNDISFEVRQGECLGILGRNGAGKSTLLQMIAQTLEPTSGSVEVRGMVAALLELGSGFNPEFTGRENVFMNAAILGLRKDEIDRKFDEIAVFADIGDFIEQPVKNYSSGMLMRLAFAVQTAVEPDILIVDEALAVGDARFQKKCFDRMYRLRENGGTIMFVTHDSGTVVQICDRAIILENGRLYGEGDPQTMARVYHRLLFEIPEESQPTSNSAVECEPEDRCQVSAATSVPQEPIVPPSEIFMENCNREVRYGSKNAEVVFAGIRDTRDGRSTLLLDVGRQYDFYAHVRYNCEVTHEVIFGFIIANAKGMEIYATNSGFHGLSLKPGRSGQIFECTMTAPIILTPGYYFLTVALAPSNTDGSKSDGYLDVRFDALQFQVIGTVRCHATSLVDIPTGLSLKMLQGN